MGIQGSFRSVGGQEFKEFRELGEFREFRV